MFASCNAANSGSSSSLSVLVSHEAMKSLGSVSSSVTEESVPRLDESSSFPDEVSRISSWLSNSSDFSVGGGV